MIEDEYEEVPANCLRGRQGLMLLTKRESGIATAARCALGARGVAVTWRTASIVLAGLTLLASVVYAEAPEHGTRPEALIIRGGMMVEGPGTPAEGPVDIFVRGNRIERIAISDRPMPDGYADAAVIDATDQYVLPGFINMHGHIHDTWMGRPSSLEYIYKLWLACGITTVRDVGSRTALTVGERERSASGEIDAPRIFLYFFWV